MTLVGEVMGCQQLSHDMGTAIVFMVTTFVDDSLGLDSKTLRSNQPQQGSTQPQHRKYYGRMVGKERRQTLIKQQPC